MAHDTCQWLHSRAWARPQPWGRVTTRRTCWEGVDERAALGGPCWPDKAVALSASRPCVSAALVSSRGELTRCSECGSSVQVVAEALPSSHAGSRGFATNPLSLPVPR